MLEFRNRRPLRYEDGDEHQNDATFLMAIDSKEVVSKSSSSSIDLNIIYLQKENEELLQFNKDFTKTFEKLLKEKRALEDKNLKLSSKINDLEIKVNKLVKKEVVEPCRKCVELIQEVDSLTNNVSKLQDEALNFSKVIKSIVALLRTIMLRFGAKIHPTDKGTVLDFQKNDKITSASSNKPIVFVKQSQKEIASTSFVKPVVLKLICNTQRSSSIPLAKSGNNTPSTSLGLSLIDMDTHYPS
ncbi:hypothetical protein Tco_0858155 [Tanacetum coccineum]|uniref:Uncharacterized protein n=1 Tax=Tanacetum coccineum TaxID=301880 RepID=A0ABQ5BBB4_9ASTR